MTPEEKELAKKRALAKARARARSNGQTVVAENLPAQAEATNGNLTPRAKPIQGQADQLASLNSLDRFFKGRGGRATTMGLQTANGLTWGGLDRGMAWMERVTPGGAPELPQRPRNREYFSGIRQDLREMHPVSAVAGDVAGVIGGGLPLDDALRRGSNELIKRLPQGKEVWKKGVRYGGRGLALAGEGLAQFGLWKAGSGASNREAETGQSMSALDRAQYVTEDPNQLKIAAAAGPTLSAGYRLGRGLMTGRVTPSNIPGGGGSAPAIDEIEGMKNDAYRLADELGVTYTPDSYQNLIAKIETKLASEGIDPVLHQRATRTLGRLQDRVGDQPMTMQELDKIRQFVRRDVIQSAQAGGTPGANAGEQRLGMMMIDAIDDFIEEGAGAIGSHGQAGSDAIRQARSLNSVWRKSQALQDAVENAQLRAASTGSGGNFENALRQEIRKIYQNPKKVAGFSEAERKAMKAVIEGDLGQNILRGIGKLSPQGNGLMAALGVGTTVANPIVAPVWLGAIGAKHLAQRGIKNKFDELDEMVREGANNVPMKNITPPKGDLPQRGDKPKGGLKDKAIDATALTVATAPHLAGKASAQETSGADLQEARQRVAYLEKNMVGGLEADLRMINDPNSDPKRLQEILQRRVNPDLAIDGVIGPQTRAAIQDMRGQLTGELETARGELDRARQRALELEQRQIYAANSGNGAVDAALDQLPLVGTAIGAAIGLRGRGGAVKKSQLTAKALEDQADNLINAAPMAPKSIMGPNSLNKRAANLNEFWRLGGAKENVPFKLSAKGEWRHKGGATDLSKLFEASKNPFRTTDVGFIAGGLGESALATQYLGESKKALKQAEARLLQAEESGNLAAYEQAMAEIEQQKMMIQIWTSMQRVGLGIAGFRGMAALKSPYAAARPNLGGAQQEQALLLQHINKGRNKLPQKPRSNN